jgi:hypothetical protein
VGDGVKKERSKQINIYNLSDVDWREHDLRVNSKWESHIRIGMPTLAIIWMEYLEGEREELTGNGGKKRAERQKKHKNK